MLCKSYWDAPYEPSKYDQSCWCIGMKKGSVSNSRKYDMALYRSYATINYI